MIAENFLIGVYRVSIQFRDNPVEIFKKAWEIVAPSFDGLANLLRALNKKD